MTKKRQLPAAAVRYQPGMTASPCGRPPPCPEGAARAPTAEGSSRRDSATGCSSPAGRGRHQTLVSLAQRCACRVGEPVAAQILTAGRIDRGASGKSRGMLKLPEGITTCLFDLDGVLTQTAKIHAQAWKEMFDGFLREWSEEHGVPFEEFDRPTDYDEYVDGKPRLHRVGSVLEARGIHPPVGSPPDRPGA